MLVQYFGHAYDVVGQLIVATKRVSCLLVHHDGSVGKRLDLPNHQPGLSPSKIEMSHGVAKGAGAGVVAGAVHE